MVKQFAATFTLQLPEPASNIASSAVVGTPALSTPEEEVEDQLAALFQTVALDLK
jgi:hypothetical protein